MIVVAIIQARMTSTRLPGKVMMDIGGQPLLQLMLSRVQKSKHIDKIVVAVPDEPESQPMIDLCQSMGIAVSKGDELDVLSRFAVAAKENGADVVVRLCSDCPLIDPVLIDELIVAFKNQDCDYMNNIEKRSYPDGLDAEIFTIEALREANEKATHPKHREHVTTYIDGRIKDVVEKGEFRCDFINNNKNYGSLMWSVNEQKDLDHVRFLYDELNDKDNFGWLDVLDVELFNGDKTNV